MATEQFEKATDSFIAKGDDGKEYTVVEHTTFIRFTPVGQGTQTLKGTVRYELDDGLPVNQRKDGAFEIVHNGKILRKV